MKINRIKKDNNFVIIATNVLRDKRLSWASKGLHSFIMQLPDDWDLTVEGLKEHSKTGRDGTATAIKELIKYGYVERIRVKNKFNQFAGYEYNIFEESKNGKAVNGFPVNGKTATIKYDNNKELINKSNNVVVAKATPTQPKFIEQFKDAIAYLNTKTGRAFQISANDEKGKTDKYKLFAKLMTTYSLEDAKAVIDNRCAEWLNDSKMCKYLQPHTIFAARNFEKYIEDIKAGDAKPKDTLPTNETHHLTEQIRSLGYTVQKGSIDKLFNSIKDIMPKTAKNDLIEQKLLVLLSSEHAKSFKGLNSVLNNLQIIIKKIKNSKNATT